MDNNNYLDKILETESAAEEIISIARLKRSEMVQKTREEAEAIIVKAKVDAACEYKEIINKANEEAKNLTDSNRLEAISAAKSMEALFEEREEKAIAKVAERIVKYCANS